MNIPNFLIENKQLIRDLLNSYLEKEIKNSIEVNTLGKEALEKLREFMQNGKFIRGGLVVFSSQMFSRERDINTLNLAVAVEILHSSLLIHDDIMDNDLLRRGQATIFAQYMDRGKDKGYKDTLLYGQGMAICIGDLAYFLAYKLMTDLQIESSIRINIINYLSTGLINVAIAQMQDMEFGFQNALPSADEILSMYKNKSGYSYILPFVAGALLSGKSIEEVEDLEKLGELFGTLFQIKDDEIGLFSQDDVSGKPQGSDIREGKKTLLYSYLYNKSNDTQKEVLMRAFGNESMTQNDLEKVLELIDELQIKKYIDGIIQKLSQTIEEKIKSVSVDTRYKAELVELLEFNLKRDH